MKLQQGPISKDDLMHRLVKSKMVMEKVDTGSYSTGNINQNDLVDDSVDYLEESVDLEPRKINHIIDEERVKNSKLPDAIKRVMIENPIPKISLNDDLDIVKGAKRLMQKESMKNNTPSKTIAKAPSTANIDTNLLTNLIENIVRKVMDEKLNQILTAQQNMTINENLMIKVGDSVFKGKITGVNKSK